MQTAKRKVKILYMQEIGHFSSQCPKQRTKKNKDSEIKDARSNKQLRRFSLAPRQRMTGRFIDSRASAYMTGNREYFIQINKAQLSHILVANDVSLPVQEVGDIKMKINSHGTTDQIIVKNTYCMYRSCRQIYL